ncbi:Asp-tRNA(Asn)/Glu-tRNA(Gln) amidotransferase subunit GatC [Alkalibaculum sp. M08DMB]|uniref:Aspartyl/glutamyl-tRNA(Asn/Gln) amidotransferase subunit C n=1 Tax=Alkalibaculum sporogenes TaxID=2655001 RepID=A0A6A7K6C2_9FIRM|nr:Asp-tRNA(Asn)/Glu-tRNA(Gln) amidotransferase subunit GatC [Alkalibaculum sporogenes]MPW24915.1 Asp-tRNA(Asn)/Glu-tRNA(Gln) amidotransferase subunit GatC [Alkalibaculum sporogenes]
MKLSIEDVVYVADLARLEFNDDELKIYCEQLTNILDYAEKLNELDTTNTQPTAHVLPINNVLREDIVLPSLDREKALQNAPSQENGCFKVPKVID